MLKLIINILNYILLTLISLVLVAVAQLLLSLADQILNLFINCEFTIIIFMGEPNAMSFKLKC